MRQICTEPTEETEAVADTPTPGVWRLALAVTEALALPAALLVVTPLEPPVNTDAMLARIPPVEEAAVEEATGTLAVDDVRATEPVVVVTRLEPPVKTDAMLEMIPVLLEDAAVEEAAGTLAVDVVTAPEPEDVVTPLDPPFNTDAMLATIPEPLEDAAVEDAA